MQGFRQATIEELIVDGLQLTVEKIHLSTSNVKDLLDKMNQKELDDMPAPENEPDEQVTGVVSQATYTAGRVAGIVSNTASGINQLGQSTAARVAAIGKPHKQEERKEAKVCIKMVDIRSITVRSVNSLVTDQSSSLSMKAPPIRIKNFSESHGTQKAAQMIQLLLKEILGSASRAPWKSQSTVLL